VGELTVERSAPTAEHDGSEVLERWVARKVQPIVLIYLIIVFVAFIALAHFILQSSEAVKALLVALVGAMGATVQPILERIEYRLTESGIEKRPVRKKKPGQFKTVVRWDELDHIVPTKHGFKYYKVMAATNPARRFWNLHLSDNFSGEVHVEKSDLERILRVVGQLAEKTAGGGRTQVFP
jgi:hypothetical protein